MGGREHPTGQRSAAPLAVGASLVVGVVIGMAAAAPPIQRRAVWLWVVATMALWAPVTGWLLVHARRLHGHTAALDRELARRRQPEILALSQLEADIAAVRAIIDGDAVTMVLQPIVWLPTNEVVGYEALARFPDGAEPPAWFERAEAAAMGTELELCCIRRALDHLDQLAVDTYLSLNASPATLLSRQLLDVLDRPDSDRVVIELTEHVRLGPYEAYTDAVARLRARGVRLAVDDAGAGFASLRHVVSLGPDIVKLDRSLVADLDRDPLRRSLVHGLASFARATHTSLVAEGVETETEALALVEQGVAFGQGFWFAPPQPVERLRHVEVVGRRAGPVPYR